MRQLAKAIGTCLRGIVLIGSTKKRERYNWYVCLASGCLRVFFPFAGFGFMALVSLSGTSDACFSLSNALALCSI
ncbi:uncharacterized protein B0P05DRAFT_553496 [Gilbertella persicaria]|uniref:uncharacterized protein n=1 Tax=Gilbertella persicaria TaxID=101096 RepID=UPI002220845B|nr:uncharacterized protein B0P05DRAFT_553496 [Gilbertella persicaria]KAI8066235.1 hypothetical protein B0P05DRAFT_553496 [Gilbertella persicaria]